MIHEDVGLRATLFGGSGHPGLAKVLFPFSGAQRLGKGWECQAKGAAASHGCSQHPKHSRAGTSCPELELTQQQQPRPDKSPLILSSWLCCPPAGLLPVLTFNAFGAQQLIKINPQSAQDTGKTGAGCCPQLPRRAGHCATATTSGTIHKSHFSCPKTPLELLVGWVQAAPAVPAPDPDFCPCGWRRITDSCP